MNKLLSRIFPGFELIYTVNDSYYSCVIKLKSPSMQETTSPVA